MIEKMMFISLTGPINQLDRIADQYLSHHDIHLENPLTAMAAGHDFSPITTPNPYRTRLAQARRLENMLSEEARKSTPATLDEAAADSALDRLKKQFKETPEKAELPVTVDSDEALAEVLKPFASLDFDLAELLTFKHIIVHAGRMPKESYDRFVEHIEADEPMIYHVTQQDTMYVWGLAAFPETEHRRMEALLISLRFEAVDIKTDRHGKPAAIIAEIEENRRHPEAAAATPDKPDINTYAAEILGMTALYQHLSDAFDIRKYAAQTTLDRRDYFALCGWMPKKMAYKLEKELDNEPDILAVISEDSPNDDIEPPTRLKNPAIFKPYEMYISMYGLPNYHEFDPTLFVALTYSLLFGIMYGDVGQGLCLLIGGLLLYKFKHITLAGIIATAGVCSTFFGFMFGSLFGFEEILPALWLRPKDMMSNLSFIGSINTVFIYAILLGVGIILLTMIFHIVLAFKRGDTAEKFFGPNGLAGLIFYGSVIFMAICFFSGNTIPAATIFIALLVLSLLALFLKEPLTHIIERRKGRAIEGGIGMFIVQGFFELFEVMLSYFSNTLSFVRVGAFAVSHAAMMQVVLMLAGAESGNPSWPVVILGNLFVMGLEGLIVGIQVLRLEYYEMFSRFYSGDGHAFVSFFKKNNA
ncbi:MAG: V-type ATPase 116kDa subunit family protein [Lachnospiraceae bacterium]|nr:V-type ATPase 116kDa subunit family protein [Lachnospiraceae bacterium]